MVLAHCKWDPQVQDVSTLAPFPLLMSGRTWKDLAERAEALAGETLAAERSILEQPRLLRRLGMPRVLRNLLASGAGPLTPAAVRWMRFDFHFTSDGWRISEVNSDVPGGFAEASGLSGLMSRHHSGTRTAGDPTDAWANALRRNIGDSGAVALLSAAGFMEDHQVVAHLARRLQAIGIDAHLAQPKHLHWHDGHAHLRTAWHEGPLAAIVRFYQAEWLARLGRRADWRPLFVSGRTPVGNPGCAAVSESKRFPLVWDELGLPLPAWREHLPETRDPRDAPWRRDDGWLVKSAYCNTGDSVAWAGLQPRRRWLKTLLDVALHPESWVAQRRFRTLPIDTPRGPMFPCIGVYTIGGRACGIHGRLSPTPVINYAATDVAVLIADHAEEDTG